MATGTARRSPGSLRKVLWAGQVLVCAHETNTITIRVRTKSSQRSADAARYLVEFTGIPMNPEDAMKAMENRQEELFTQVGQRAYASVL